MSKYYDMLPPICKKLGIEIPDLYIELDVSPNSYTSGDTKPFIVMTSGLLETLPDELIPTVLAHECGHIACHHVLYSTMGRMILREFWDYPVFQLWSQHRFKSLLPIGCGAVSFPQTEQRFFMMVRRIKW